MRYVVVAAVALSALAGHAYGQPKELRVATRPSTQPATRPRPRTANEVPAVAVLLAERDVASKKAIVAERAAYAKAIDQADIKQAVADAEAKRQALERARQTHDAANKERLDAGSAYTRAQQKADQLIAAALANDEGLSEANAAYTVAARRYDALVRRTRDEWQKEDAAKQAIVAIKYDILPVDLQVGQLGKLGDYPRKSVERIINDHEMLVRYEGRTFLRSLWFRGFDTNGLADDDPVVVKTPVKVTGTHKNGGSTYMVIEPAQ